MRALLLRALVASLSISGLSAGAATSTVVSANNDGPGSLREAIVTANNNEGEDTITFDLPGGGPHVIDLTTELPALSSSIAVLNDGASDEPVTVRRSAASGTPYFRIFTVTGENSVSIAGLTIANGNVYFYTKDEFGGGVDNQGARVTLRKCNIVGNQAKNGGGLSMRSRGRSATLLVEDCTIAENNGVGSGGGIFIGALDEGGQVSLTVIRSAIIKNAANSLFTRGGGISSSSGNGAATVNLTNCTFSGNFANYAHAVYTRGPGALSQLFVTNCTFGSLDRVEIDGGIGEIANNIFRSSSVSAYQGGVLISRGHNLSDDAAQGGPGTAPGGVINGPGDQRNTDPRLGLLQRNGGPTVSYALLPDSPAIDAGDHSIAPRKDQRGFGRTGLSDIGAFEFAYAPPTSLANISTRLRIGTGDNVLIGGFIISGSGPKRLILRAIGPSLGMAGQLEDPKLEIYDSLGGLIASNDDWEQAPNKQEVVDSGVAPSDALESALVRSFDPGAYTAIVRGVNDTTGVGLVEVYDLNRGANATLANISTRGFVDTGDNVLIGGIIIVGPDPQRVIVRAIGPSLPKRPKLADPTLDLYDSNGTLIAANDDWRTNEAEVAATGIPPSNDAESAIVGTLAPGAYTAIVRGKSGTTGTALVEVYALD